MDKEQYDFIHDVCECCHIRDLHNGIEGYCYVGGCPCMQFKKIN